MGTQPTLLNLIEELGLELKVEPLLGAGEAEACVLAQDSGAEPIEQGQPDSLRCQLDTVL